MSKPRNIVLKTLPAEILISPYAMARFSTDMHNLIIESGDGITYPASKYYIYCLSIELAIKSSLRNSGACSKDLIGFGHNLGKLANEFSSKITENILRHEDVAALVAISKYYDKNGNDSKSIVYAGPSLLEQMLKGYKDLPSLKSIEAVSIKLQEYLRRNNYFN